MISGSSVGVLLDDARLAECASTNGRLLPSPPGTSPTVPPATLTTALSMPMPAEGGHAVLDVSTNSVPLRKHVRRGRLRTFCDQGGDGGDLAVLLADEGDARARSAGAKVSVAVSPENNPGPTTDASFKIVFCRSLTSCVPLSLWLMPDREGAVYHPGGKLILWVSPLSRPRSRIQVGVRGYGGSFAVGRFGVLGSRRDAACARGMAFLRSATGKRQ